MACYFFIVIYIVYRRTWVRYKRVHICSLPALRYRKQKFYFVLSDKQRGGNKTIMNGFQGVGGQSAAGRREDRAVVDTRPRALFVRLGGDSRPRQQKKHK